MIETLKNINYPKEQIEILLNEKAGTIASNLAVPIFFIYILKDFVPIHILISVSIIQLIIFFIRLIIINKMLNILYKVKDEIINSWLKWYLFFIFLNASILGIYALLVILYANEIYVYILIGIISTITTGSLTTLSSVFHAIFIYIITLYTILILGLIFIIQSTMYHIIAMPLILLMYVSLTSGFRIYKSINTSIKQKENFKKLLDITMEAIIISDEQHIITDINQSGLTLFNIKSKSDVIGKSVLDFVPDYSLQTIQNAMKQEIQEPYELDIKKQDGEIFPTLISSRNLIMNDKKIRIGTVLDLTQLKQKDKQLIQQSRLAQMGEMISMIAHQWRQPLTAISATSNNLTLKLMMNDIDNKEFEKEIGLISDYAQHLSKTIDDFRGFFKENKEKEKTTLDNLIYSTLDIVKVSLDNKNIDIKTDLNSTIELKTYPNEVKQVILNLIKNAQDALLDNKIKNPTITINTRYKNNHHIIDIKDNAGGIPSDIIDKIFEPYFSTKKEKDGTGLGLYMSKTIIQEHCGGTLNISNDENGAVFTIKLL